MVPAGDTTLVSFPVVCTDPAGSTGGLQVNAMTTGEEDGYTVVIDNDVGAGQALEVDGMVTFAALTSGNHSVELTDFGPSCVVAGDNPRTVTVVQDVTASTDFDVACGLTVNVTTIGSDFDPDGYSVIVDAGSLITPVDIDGSVWLDIAPGLHDIELIDLASGCRVSDDNPRNIDSPGEETFEVTCGPAITFDRNFNIWQILPDGNSLRQLTTDGTAGRYSHVKWSPDGTRMVFSRSGAIFTADPDGTDAVQVTFPELGVSHVRPDWSYDGTKLVVYQSDDRGVWKLSVLTVNPDGSDTTTVKAGDGTTINDAFPSWTPDGEIVYVERVIGEDGDDGFVAVMNADGSNVRRRTTALGARIYEPDHSGNRIAFKRKLYDTETSFDLMVMDAGGSDLNLENLSDQAYGVGDIELSPDGSQIAYILEGGAGGLWIIDTDGSNPIRLTDAAGVAWRTLP